MGSWVLLSAAFAAAQDPVRQCGAAVDPTGDEQPVPLVGNVTIDWSTYTFCTEDEYMRVIQEKPCVGEADGCPAVGTFVPVRRQGSKVFLKKGNGVELNPEALAAITFSNLSLEVDWSNGAARCHYTRPTACSDGGDEQDYCYQVSRVAGGNGMCRLRATPRSPATAERLGPPIVVPLYVPYTLCPAEGYCVVASRFPAAGNVSLLPGSGPGCTFFQPEASLVEDVDSATTKAPLGRTACHKRLPVTAPVVLGSARTGVVVMKCPESLQGTYVTVSFGQSEAQQTVTVQVGSPVAPTCNDLSLSAPAGGASPERSLTDFFQAAPGVQACLEVNCVGAVPDGLEIKRGDEDWRKMEWPVYVDNSEVKVRFHPAADATGSETLVLAKGHKEECKPVRLTTHVAPPAAEGAPTGSPVATHPPSAGEAPNSAEPTASTADPTAAGGEAPVESPEPASNTSEPTAAAGDAPVATEPATNGPTAASEAPTANDTSAPSSAAEEAPVDTPEPTDTPTAKAVTPTNATATPTKVETAGNDTAAPIKETDANATATPTKGVVGGEAPTSQDGTAGAPVATDSPLPPSSAPIVSPSKAPGELTLPPYAPSPDQNDSMTKLFMFAVVAGVCGFVYLNRHVVLARLTGSEETYGQLSGNRDAEMDDFDDGGEVHVQHPQPSPPVSQPPRRAAPPPAAPAVVEPDESWDAWEGGWGSDEPKTRPSSKKGLGKLGAKAVRIDTNKEA
eukprot:TRINITY_DN47785_c0_g1_i1.p1 TRINITY_DN47785_c0_g1~~TRINITY_DN47785_c0_g1_i1.p1  ORF type:complete len:733 (+),score=118.90 TRINITY_DN47785_c0_g1_i1:61-2259(+)